MRRLGYLVVDRIVDHLEGLAALPPIRHGDAGALRAALGGPPPEEPGDPELALRALFDEVLPFGQHGDHPRFFARIRSPSNFVSVLADAAASGFNVFSGSWAGAPARRPSSWSWSTGCATSAGCRPSPRA